MESYPAPEELILSLFLQFLFSITYANFNNTNEIIIVTFLRNPPLPAGERTKVRGKAVSEFNAFVLVPIL